MNPRAAGIANARAYAPCARCSTRGRANPTTTKPSQKTSAHCPVSKATTDAAPASLERPTKNSKATTSTVSTQGSHPWTRSRKASFSTSLGQTRRANKNTAQTPVDIADTRNKNGSTALFHRGNVFTTPKRTPVYMATAIAKPHPAASKPKGTLFFSKSRTTHHCRDDDEGRKEHHAPRHHRLNVAQQQGKAPRMEKSSLRVHHQKHEAHRHRTERDHSPRAHRALGLRSHPAHPAVAATNAPAPRPARNRYIAMGAPKSARIPRRSPPIISHNISWPWSSRQTGAGRCDARSCEKSRCRGRPNRPPNGLGSGIRPRRCTHGTVNARDGAQTALVHRARLLIAHANLIRTCGHAIQASDALPLLNSHKAAPLQHMTRAR